MDALSTVNHIYLRVQIKKTEPDPTTMGCERTRVGEAEGERNVLCVCVGDGWGLQVYCSRTGRGQKREAFQTPTHRLLFPY